MASGAAKASSKVVKVVKEAVSKSVKTPASSKAVKTSKVEVSKEAKKPTISGLNAPLPVSAACKKFFGQVEMSRIDATKQIWAYIKSNNLQDPEKKRIIVPDEKMKTFLSCKERIDMTELAGLLSAHFPKKSP